MAAERQAAHLAFTTEYRHAEGFDVLFTSGTLQYADQDLPGMLSRVTKPRHLLINYVPLTDHPTFFTTQEVGPICCAYRIGNRAEFVESLQRLGYTLIDSWRCPDKGCRVLFHPKRRVRAYSGMYWRLESAR